MSRKHDVIAEAPGHDSFVDVVANLVAIIIILIVLIGSRAKDAILEEATDAEEPATQVDPELAAAATDSMVAADAIETDINEISSRISKGTMEVAYRRNERDRVNLLITMAEQELTQRRGQLDESQQQQFDAERQIIQARDELANLKQVRDFLQTAQSQPTIVEHLPTPMAKTVFGREVHVRLLNGRLTVLPWEELVNKLKEDAPQKVFRLRDATQVTETLGPIDGFWLRYTLKRVEKQVRTNVGMAVQSRIELDRFVIIPVAENLGELLETALGDGSPFRATLHDFDPSRTTVSVWVYPDSFQHFGQLKHTLYNLGFLAAARPLPEGHPIGGSPDGTRSAAQ